MGQAIDESVPARGCVGASSRHANVTFSLHTVFVFARVLVALLLLTPVRHAAAATMKEFWRVEHNPQDPYDLGFDSVAIDPSGEIVAGRFGQGVILKFDRWGSLLWQHDPNGDIPFVGLGIPSAFPPRARRIAIDANGHIVVGVATKGEGWQFVGFDHLAPSGASLWHTLFPLGPWDSSYVSAVQVWIDGAGNEIGVFNLRLSGGPSILRDQAFVAAVDRDGTPLWTWTSPDGFNYQVFDSALRPGGGLAIFGRWCQVPGWGCPTGAWDARVFTFFPSGILNWNRIVDGGNDDSASAIAVDGQGRVYVHATSQTTVGTGILHPESEVVAYDPNGITLWQASESSTSRSEYADGIAVAPSGNIYSSYHTLRPNASDDSVVVRYSPSGAVLWTHPDTLTGDVLREELAADPADRAVSLVSRNDDGVESWQVGGITSGNASDFSLTSNGPASSWAFAIDGLGQPVAGGSERPPWGPFQLLVRYERFDYRPIRKRMVEGPIWVKIPPVERQFARAPQDWTGVHARGGERFDVGAWSKSAQLPGVQLSLYAPDRATLLGGGTLQADGSVRLGWTAPSPGLYWVKTQSSDGQFGDQRYYHLGIDGPISPSALFSRSFSGLRHVAGQSALELLNGGMLVLGRGASAPGAHGVDWLNYSSDLATIAMHSRIVPAQPGFAGDFDSIGAAQNADGSFWIVGTLTQPGPIQVGAAHVDPVSGDVLRGLLLGTPEQTEARAVLQLTNGDLILVMRVGGSAGSGDRVALARLTAQGDAIWSRAYDLGASADPRGAVAMGDDSLVVAYDGSPGGILRVDGDDGTLSWQTQIVSSGSPSLPLPPPQIRGIAATGDGSLLLTGNVQNADLPDQDVWIARLDSLGNVRWSKSYGGLGTDNATAIANTGDDGIVVSGWTDSFGAGGRDGWVLRLDGYGQPLWQFTYGTPQDEELDGVSEPSDNGIVATGRSFDASGAEQLWVLKLGSNGELVNGCAMGQQSAAPVRDFGISIEYGAFVSQAAGPPIGAFGFESQAVSPPAVQTACSVFMPAEISGPTSPQLIFTSHDQLQWDPAASGSGVTFMVYRGDVRTDLPALRSGSCLQRDLTDNHTSDTSLPATGSANFYLVSGMNQLGEGPLGKRSDGTTRANTSPCP